MTQERFWHLLTKKISREATDADLAELEALIRVYPDWYYSAKEVHHMWNLPLKEDQVAAEMAFQKHLNNMANAGFQLDGSKTEPAGNLKKQSPAFFVYKNWHGWLAAASVLAIVSIVLFKIFLKPNDTGGKLSEVSTRNGSKTKLILPDGTVVWLNAGSKLTYEKNFGTSSRHVTLEGEAFFDVVKMPDLPFTIQTKVIGIKVLGTAFNVKSYSNEPTTETSLLRGQVEITVNRRPGEKFILLPNNKLVVANEADHKKAAAFPQRTKMPMVSLHELTYEPDSTIIETSWKENKLAFQDESFEEIAKKMERWYNMKIQFLDKSLAAERMSGSFENETINQALEALQISTNFHFTIYQNEITITK